MEEPKKKQYKAPDVWDLNGFAARGMCVGGSSPDGSGNCTDGMDAGFDDCGSGGMASTSCSSGDSVAFGPCSTGGVFYVPCSAGSTDM